MPCGGAAGRARRRAAAPRAPAREGRAGCRGSRRRPCEAAEAPARSSERRAVARRELPPVGLDDAHADPADAAVDVREERQRAVHRGADVDERERAHVGVTRHRARRGARPDADHQRVRRVVGEERREMPEEPHVPLRERPIARVRHAVREDAPVPRRAAHLDHGGRVLRPLVDREEPVARREPPREGRRGRRPRERRDRCDDRERAPSLRPRRSPRQPTANHAAAMPACPTAQTMIARCAPSRGISAKPATTLPPMAPTVFAEPYAPAARAVRSPSESATRIASDVVAPSSSVGAAGPRRPSRRPSTVIVHTVKVVASRTPE